MISLGTPTRRAPRSTRLRRASKDLSSVTAKPKIDLAIEDAQRRLTAVTKELGELRQMKSSPRWTFKCARRRAGYGASSPS